MPPTNSEAKELINIIYTMEMDAINKAKDLAAHMDAGAPHYLQRLEEIAATEEPFLPINCGHTQQFTEDLYRQIVCYPQAVIPALDMAINEVLFLKHVQCSICRNTADIDIEKGRISELTLRPNGQTNHSLDLVHKQSRFTDKQMMKLKESPDNMPAGQTRTMWRCTCMVTLWTASSPATRCP